MEKQNKPNVHLLKREIKYRARRSIKEMDEVIGRFVVKELDKLSPDLLTELKNMLEEMDQDLWASWEGRKPIPPEYQRIFALLKVA